MNPHTVPLVQEKTLPYGRRKCKQRRQYFQGYRTRKEAFLPRRTWKGLQFTSTHWRAKPGGSISGIGNCTETADFTLRQYPLQDGRIARGKPGRERPRLNIWRTQSGNMRSIATRNLLGRIYYSSSPLRKRQDGSVKTWEGVKRKGQIGK